MKRSKAQREFLIRMFAERNELLKDNCHCTGCAQCDGFIPGCTCDTIVQDIPLFAKARQQRAETPQPVPEEQPKSVRRKAPARKPGPWNAATYLRGETDSELPGESDESYPF